MLKQLHHQSLLIRDADAPPHHQLLMHRLAGMPRRSDSNSVAPSSHYTPHIAEAVAGGWAGRDVLGRTTEGHMATHVLVDGSIMCVASPQSSLSSPTLRKNGESSFDGRNVPRRASNPASPPKIKSMPCLALSSSNSSSSDVAVSLQREKETLLPTPKPQMRKH